MRRARATATPRWHRAAGLIAGILIVGVSSVRVGAADIWGEVGLPGGVAAARAVSELGQPAGRMDAGFLLDFARKYSGINPAPVVERLARYFKAIERMQSAVGAWPDGFVLPTDATPRVERDRLDATLASLGFGLRRRGNAYESFERTGDDDRERLAWLKGLGADPAAIVTNLNRGLRVQVPVTESALPLPLPEFWRTEVFDRNRLPLESILRDRSAWLTYHGLMALDEETLTYLGGQLRLVRRLRESSAAFAAFGRSIVVHAGQLQLPGGPGTAPIWERLVGRKVAQPDEFIAELVARDAGRMAYFYDVVSHLGTARQHAVLGSHLDGAPRVEFANRIYTRFSSIDPNWKIEPQPFNRPFFDAAEALVALEARPDGSVGPAWWPSLLERVADNREWPKTPEDTTKRMKDTPADMVWALNWIFDSPQQAEGRYRLLRFAQRLIPNAAREAAPAFEVALRTFVDMPALALALERLGVGDLATFSTVARSARALTTAGGGDTVLPVLARWQASLGLLEQIQRRAHLSAPDLSRLLASLATALPTQLDRPSAAAAAWTIEQLLPVLLPTGGLEGDVERRALSAFTDSPAARTRPFTWEGLQYIANPSAVVLKDVLTMRTSRRGPALQDLVAMYRLSRSLEAGLETLDDVRAITTRLAVLEPVVALLPEVNGQPHPVVASFRGSIKNIQSIRNVSDVKKAMRELPVVLTAVEALTDAVVPPILYALAVSPTMQPTIYVDTWSLHRLADTQEPGSVVAPRPWQQAAWQVPQLSGGSGGKGSGVVGAYLSVDIALAEAHWARLPLADEPPDRTLNHMDRSTAAQGLVMPGLDVLMDEKADALVTAALKSGREIVASWKDRPPAPAQLAAKLRAAAVDEWTTNLLIWTHASGARDPFASLRPTDVFRLGSADEPPVAWSGSAGRIDGCHCGLAADRRSPEDQRGMNIGMQTVGPQDLPLRLAEILHDLALPVSLVPALLPVAALDWIDHVQPAWLDDWEASVLWPRALSNDRVEEYLLFLTSRGVLVAADARGGGTR